MSTNITTAFLAGGDGIIISAPTVTANPGSLAASMVSRIIAVHAYSTIAGNIVINDVAGAKITLTVPASGTADVYLGEAGIKCNGQVSIATPDAGSVTLILG
jgi:hypothetical protein